MGRLRGGGRIPEKDLAPVCLDYYDVDGYKEELLAAEPGLASDRAYERALERAKGEASAYLDRYIGLESRWPSPGTGTRGAGQTETRPPCSAIQRTGRMITTTIPSCSPTAPT